MSRPALTSWHDSPFTGLFSRWGPIPLRPHDPAVPAWSGVMPRCDRCAAPADGGDLAVGGAGADLASAEAAALGEAVERWQARPLPADHRIETSFARWSMDEPAVDPARWVLYHPEQYTLPGFPFAPLTRETECRWVCCRTACEGEPWWVPDWLIFLTPGGGQSVSSLRPHGPSLSTGLSAGKADQPVLLRGLQEVIERDALVGAWWERYPLEEHDPDRVFAQLAKDLPARLIRPNLRYRFYRVGSPFSAHATIATLAGDDEEGFCFSAGSACRETRAASWTKAVFEAVQGRHYVRYLWRTSAAARARDESPVDFAGHALYYSLHPDRLRRTVLERAAAATSHEEETLESWPVLRERLGRDRAVLFRLLTPPGVSAAGAGWVVLRVLVPGLQPLHGSHGFPFLGGSLWSPRGLAEYAGAPPHPFP